MTEIREIALKIFLAARMAAGFDFGARFRLTIYIPEPRSGWGKWGWDIPRRFSSVKKLAVDLPIKQLSHIEKKRNYFVPFFEDASFFSFSILL